MEPIIGIDLGTTNSEVAFAFDGHVEVIGDNDNGILPSCVGMSEDGRIIVGTEARNQAIVAPQRTVLSVKRRMGNDEKLKLGDAAFFPQEIAAFVLKALRKRAEHRIGQAVNKAVITVPAYFTDAQRQATREAGQIAGLEVVRIINEPTAAALAYESLHGESQRILVYDLGGGTFDVSIVRIEEGVVEVLSSTGDNRLGGDDFDQRIVNLLISHLEEELKLTVRKNPLVMARLQRAAETAKIELSTHPFTTVEEDHIGKKMGRDVHLSMEISRQQFEEMIEADLVRTMESISKALKDASLLPGAIGKIILVGGSTRIPRISEMLEEKFKHRPHAHIDPDLCVAMGAGIQAAREMGKDDSGVLVDITPYTFGTSAMGEIDGQHTLTMFVPLIRRNAKLPARHGKVFFTVADGQKEVDVRIYQGEAPDAEDNILLGNYSFKLTPAPAGSKVILDFELDLNGILKIKAIEKKTGKYIDAVIENAISRFDEQALNQTRERIDTFWDEGREGERVSADSPAPKYAAIIRQAEEKLPQAAEEDRDEIINLIEDIRDALKADQRDEADRLYQELDDILFYIG